MNNTIKQLLFLIKSSIETTPVMIFENVDWELLYTLAEAHNIAGTIAETVMDLQEVPEAVKSKFEQIQLQNIYLEANQDAAANSLIKQFELNGIDCMPLKGIILKCMYPSPEMRGMCDVDMLIRSSEIDRIRTIMYAQDFEFVVESAHEYIFKSGVVTVELHKSLVPNYNKVLFNYYGDGWKFAKLKSNCEHIFEMPFEDFYVYELAHTAKHYLNGGISIKQIVDIWILNKSSKYMQADKAYIQNELRKLGLKRFAEIMMQLIMAWFAGEEYTNDSKEMANYVIASSFCDMRARAESSKVYRAASDERYVKAKIKNILAIIFPTPSALMQRYKILNGKQWLYPLVVVFRWFDALLHRRGNVRKNLEGSLTSERQIREFAEHCRQMGLQNTL